MSYSCTPYKFTCVIWTPNLALLILGSEFLKSNQINLAFAIRGRYY